MLDKLQTWDQHGAFLQEVMFMSEENRAVIKKYYELLDAGDLDGVEAICADNLSDHGRVLFGHA